MAPTTKEGQRAELHKTIWRIANDLRGSVDGWDFKSYVLGILFYRFISENLANYINEGELKAGDNHFDYVVLSDENAEFGGLGEALGERIALDGAGILFDSAQADEPRRPLADGEEAGEFPPVHGGHREVEDHDVGPFGLGDAECLRPAVSGPRGVPVATEEFGEAIGGVRDIVDDEYGEGRRRVFHGRFRPRLEAEAECGCDIGSMKSRRPEIFCPSGCGVSV